MESSAEKFIAAQRALLDRLEHFVSTERYRRLKSVVADADAALPEAWLAEWLISRAHGLNGLPIDIASEPGDIHLLEAQLLRIVSDAGN